MKSLIIFIVGMIFIIGIAGVGVNLLNDVVSENPLDVDDDEVEQQVESEIDLSVESENSETKPLHQWIYHQRDDLISTFGEPDRMDTTSYGYEWYVYHSEDKQFAVNKDEEIVSVYSNSENVMLAKVQISDDYQFVSSVYPFEKENRISKTIYSYTFELTEGELKERPLAYIEDGIWAQFYFDTFTGELSSVRYLDEETLLVQRPYSLTYNGELPEKVILTEDEKQDWQRGQAKQIIELTNKIREKHELNLLEWHESAAETAFLHSKEMHDLDYFSHTSEIEGELSDRLKREEVSYQKAAENIAAKYIDGIAAVEGWLNSEGHRVNLLNDDFTHLGVGVFEDYYTQNFITPR